MTLVARHAALSDIGLHRKTNEDAFVVAPPLFAVCDGMGGAQAGEVASGLAAETLAASVAAGRPLLEAARAANSAVFARANDNIDQTGMGTTLTALLLEDGQGRFAHVGDSRAYLLRDGELAQVTDDHSLVGEMVREGRLTPEEAAVHPHRSILSRALGTEPAVKIDEFELELRLGDTLLLCSDGLSGAVGGESIRAALGRDDLDEAARRLIAEAKRQGGHDNITAVIVRLVADDADAGDEAGAVTAAAPSADVELAEAELEDAEAELEELEATGEAAAGDEPAAGAGKAARHGRVTRRQLGGVVIVLAVLVLVALGAAIVLSTCYFVGVDDNGLAVYSGLPLSIGPLDLHAVYRRSALPYGSLDATQRKLVDEQAVRSRGGAMALAEQLGMWP